MVTLAEQITQQLIQGSQSFPATQSFPVNQSFPTGTQVQQPSIQQQLQERQLQAALGGQERVAEQQQTGQQLGLADTLAASLADVKTDPFQGGASQFATSFASSFGKTRQAASAKEAQKIGRDLLKSAKSTEELEDFIASGEGSDTQQALALKKIERIETRRVKMEETALKRQEKIQSNQSQLDKEARKEESDIRKEQRSLENAIKKENKKGLTPENAAKLGGARRGLANVKEIRKIFFDKEGQLNELDVFNANFTLNPFGGESAGLIGTEGRRGKALLFNAINAQLRAESGAAVPETEVERAMLRFAPAIGDSDRTARDKLGELEKLLQNTVAGVEGGKFAEIPTTETPADFTSLSDEELQAQITALGG